MQYVNLTTEYRIKKDQDGRWCIKGILPSGQEMATVYANTTVDLFEIFVLLDGSQMFFCADAEDVPPTPASSESESDMKSELKAHG
jgi:hypothetical protein